MLAIVAASHSHPKVAFAFICVIVIRGFWLLVPIQLFGQHDNGDDDDKMVMLPTTMVKKHKKKRALGMDAATSLPMPSSAYLVLEGALVRHCATWGTCSYVPNPDDQCVCLQQSKDVNGQRSVNG